MSKKQNNLSQEEIWDDSALIDSWNEALNEYKKYHSIHAKGGSLRDLKSQTQTAVKAESNSEQLQAKETDDTKLDLKAAEENKETPSSDNEAKGPTVPQGLPSFPIQTVLGSVQDENLKKLLMSWYYAGYYTGLYEGSQQQTQQNHGS
ncbi:hypothetical protein BKA59DRAFT_456227 [Fusarium tricinctum]|uniref:Survival Motor Neuron Gemin2-binding domain-containing protein n=1 Tax=Fusarium tricinctum TaxID=61284 RepID=A0A8K0RT63_9HYPO|nr:hypothetical protein BKA59DRAFT_456227 [Fusarium tricinctum]